MMKRTQGGVRMITHKRAKELVNCYNEETPENLLLQYIAQQEQLSKDIARFLELENMLYLQWWHSEEETVEYQELRYKLSKVGKEE